MTSLPGGQRRESFLRYFLPSKGSLISCRSSTMMEVPFIQVFGLLIVLWFALLGSLSIWLGVLFLFDAIFNVH